MTAPTLTQNLGSYIVGNNTSDLIFTYKADTAIAGHLHVTLQNLTGADPDSVSQPLVVGDDPTQATATFKLKVTSASSVSFGAKVNDSENTSLSPTYNGTVTDYSLASVELNLSGNFLQLKDETDYVTASTVLQDNTNHTLGGEDLLVRATGADDTEDAFGKYVDVYLDPAGTALDVTKPPFEKVTYGKHIFNVLRLNSDSNGGGVKFFLKPNPNLKGGGHVTLLSHLGTQSVELRSGDLFVLSPTPTAGDTTGLLSPSIDHLDGMYLQPPQDAVNCTAIFPPPKTTDTGCAITNIVNNKTMVIALVKKENLTVISEEVNFSFPLAKLTHCAQPGHCVSSDFNQVGYIMFNAQEASYSNATAFYLDTPVQNDPPDGGGITRGLDVPLLFQAKADGSKTADTSKPIKPGGPDNGGQWITPDDITNGLVIRVPYSAAIAHTKVNGRLYLTGWDDFTANANGQMGVPKIYNNPLFSQDMTVTAAGKDIFIQQSTLYGYDVNPAPGPDAGFWIEYWDASNTDTRSVKYWNPLNTQPIVN